MSGTTQDSPKRRAGAFPGCAVLVFWTSCLHWSCQSAPGQVNYTSQLIITIQNHARDTKLRNEDELELAVQHIAFGKHNAMRPDGVTELV